MFLCYNILLYRRRPVISVRRSGLKVSLPETRLLKLALLKSTQKLSEGACTTRAEAPKMLRFKSCPTFTKKQEGFWDKNKKMSLWQGLPKVTFNFNPSPLESLADLVEKYFLALGVLARGAEAQHHGQLLDGAGAGEPDQGVLQVLHCKVVVLNTKRSESLTIAIYSSDFLHSLTFKQLRRARGCMSLTAFPSNTFRTA